VEEAQRAQAARLFDRAMDLRQESSLEIPDKVRLNYACLADLAGLPEEERDGSFTSLFAGDFPIAGLFFLSHIVAKGHAQPHHWTYAIYQFLRLFRHDIASFLAELQAGCGARPFDAEDSFYDPDFVIIGTMKGGTTMLYHLLTQHPDIENRQPKELHYFTEHSGPTSMQEYRRFFSGKCHGVKAGEASPSYFDVRLPGDTLPARFARDMPNTLFILSLADPARRFVSEYYHNLRASAGAEYGQTYFDQSQILSVQLFDQAVAENVPAIITSRYELRLDAWLQGIPRERLIVVSQEKLRQDHRSVLGECFERLGLAPHEADLGSGKDRNVNKYPIPDGLLSERMRAEFEPTRAFVSDRLGADFW